MRCLIMEIGEIIKDAAMYPINNVKALVIYAVLMIIAILALVFTGVGILGASEASGAAAGGLGIMGILGIIIAIAIFALISGYMLDVIKIAINRGDDAPEIEPVRQIINGIKLLVLSIVYIIIPIIVMVLLSAINDTLGLIIGIILLILFCVLLLVAQCRFAKTESLGEALNFGEVIGDIKEIGIVKVLAIIIIVGVIGYILSLIGNGIGQFSEAIGGIITAIIGVYLAFFQNRAYGLLYSDAE